MKRAFIPLVAAALLFSCTERHSSDAGRELVHEVDAEQADHEAHADHAGLALNGEERWQADEATNENIAQLQQLMQEHLNGPEANSVEALQELGRGMQAGFQEVFDECRIQGPEHDMLHVYLMPMLEDVKALETADLKTALAARDRLAQRLEQYQTYFR